MLAISNVFNLNKINLFIFSIDCITKSFMPCENAGCKVNMATVSRRNILMNCKYVSLSNFQMTL